MSTELNHGAPVSALPHVPGLKVGIVAAEWNAEVTDALLEGAQTRLVECGYSADDITVERVPGTVELTFGAAAMARTGNFDAIIVIGCVIRGGTPHFDYVCQSVTQGTTLLNATGNTPVIFCVLTTENQQQALDRAGGALTNKGTEAADAAIVMADYARRMK